MDRRTASRRELLLTGSAVTLSLVAGCTGGSDGSDDANDEPADGGESSTNDETSDTDTDDGATGGGEDPDGNESSENEYSTSDQFDEPVPADAAFIANPNVSGPGGDALYCPVITLSDDGDVNEFERLVILVQEIVLYRANGASVTVPIDVRLDCLAYERASGSQGDTITLGWELEIPTGEYTHMDFVAMADGIVHETDADVLDVEGLENVPLGTDPDEGMEVDADDVLRTLQDARITYDANAESVAIEETSPSGFVGISAVPSTYNSDEFYEND